MLRDVFCASINKGQLPILLVGIIFLVMVVRMPPEDVSKLAFQTLEELKNLHLLGYATTVLVLVLWYKHAQLMRSQLLGRTERPPASAPQQTP